MAEPEQNRSEAATPHKLAEARRRGQVPRSADLGTLGALGACLLLVQGWAAGAMDHLQHHAQRQIALAGQGSHGPAALRHHTASVLDEALHLLGTPMLVLTLVALLAGWLQHGGVFSPLVLRPDPQRLNPLQGLRRLLSRRAWFDLAKSVLKVALLAAVTVHVLRSGMATMAALASAPPGLQRQALLDLIAQLLGALLLAMTFLAWLDMVNARRSHARELRMSRRELREEHRQREGDPQIRQRLRQMRDAMRRNTRALRQVPSAQVVITNPRHLAVALAWRPGDMAAPKVVAKGAGDMAARIRELARRHGVPIVPHQGLARALHACELDQTIPETHYADVARLLVWLQDMRRARGGVTAAAGSNA